MGVAENGGSLNGLAYPEKGSWTIGLVNSKYKYLSAETFGFKVNANGTAMKKKQVWVLEPYGDGDSICLKSHLGKYLAVDQFGNVTCENEEKGDNELWHVHLAARPQVNLRSVGRKRFARLSEERTEIQVEENVPWGEDTLFTLEFREDANKYAIHTCNNMYLNKNGVLQPMVSKDCLFACEYHGGYIALRDQEGLYLSPIGSRAVLKTRSNVVTKDELFSLEDSLPQASFISAANTRYVSVKQGVDVTANQEEVENTEMFQLEYEHSSGNWYIRTMEDKYFTLQPGGGVQASASKKSKEALFQIMWHQDGAVSFKASNGQYVGTKKSGHLFANMDNIEENARFYFYLVNRPILVLKCDQGFVGYRTGTIKLECNKATYETIQVERGDLGIVFFKGQNDKYWVARDGGIFCDSDTPKGFYLELREPTRMCIKTAGGQYIVSQKNGGFSAESVNSDAATRWEY